MRPLLLSWIAIATSLAAPICMAKLPEIISSWTGRCFATDSKGFLRPIANAEDCHKRLLLNEQVIVDSTIHTDSFGRRIVPQSEKRKTDKFIAFLGCSFTFGEGVQDSESYPAQVAQLSPLWKVYNYGSPGYGPNNVLESLSNRNLTQEIQEHHGKFVYLWITDHAYRAVGALSRPYIDYAPHYELNADGKPVLGGSFEHDQPLRYRIYDWLRRWHIGEKLGFDIPPRITHSDLDLSVALLREIQATTQKAFPGSEFYVAIWPDNTTPLSRRTRKRFLKEFETGAIHFLDTSTLRLHETYSLPDGHPSAEGYRSLAERIARDIGTTQSPR